MKRWSALLMLAMVCNFGCSDTKKNSAGSGSTAPSLDSPNPAERKAAMEDIDKKYGTGS